MMIERDHIRLDKRTYIKSKKDEITEAIESLVVFIESDTRAKTTLEVQMLINFKNNLNAVYDSLNYKIDKHHLFGPGTN